MISAAKGAEKFYTLENHTSRSEDLDTARMLDTKAAEAWVGHPNVDSVMYYVQFVHFIKDI